MKEQRPKLLEKRRARLLVAIKGKFTNWHAGQIVIAQRIGPNSYSIERVRWTATQKLPLTNMLAGVPRSAFEYLPTTEQGTTGEQPGTKRTLPDRKGRA